jgi:hypothetical protein
MRRSIFGVAALTMLSLVVIGVTTAQAATYKVEINGWDGFYPAGPSNFIVGSFTVDGTANFNIDPATISNVDIHGTMPRFGSTVEFIFDQVTNPTATWTAWNGTGPWFRFANHNYYAGNTYFSMFLNSEGSGTYQIGQSPSANNSEISWINGAYWSPIVGQMTITAITPLPGALPLFATGLGALSLLGWRRKKKATALAA